MESLSDIRIIIILLFSLYGLINTIYSWRYDADRFRSTITDPLFYIFLFTIIINLLFPLRWWSLIIGFIISIGAIISSIPFQIIYSKIKQFREDQKVQKEFRNWMYGGNISNNTFSKENPICPKCKTVYNRDVVISLLKKQSPEIFQFPTWTTKFICKKCRAHIIISGVRGE